MENRALWGLRNVSLLVLVALGATGACSSSRKADPSAAEKTESVSAADTKGDGGEDNDCDRDDPPVCTLTQQSATTLTEHIAAHRRSKGHCASFVADLVMDESAHTEQAKAQTRVNGQLLVQYTLTQSTASKAQQATFHWGHLAHGATDASFSMDGTTISGSIDGRAFQPFPQASPPAALTFVDGKPGPELHTPDGVSDAVEALQPDIQAAAATCPKTPSPAAIAVTPALRVTGDLGHHSDTYNTGPCNGCQFGACLGGDVVASALCCIATVGIGCPICVGGAQFAAVACEAACLNSNACCPVACFPTQFLGQPPCCFAGETCVDPNFGACCGTDQSICGGKFCCNIGSETCTSSPNPGCCANANACGSNCCTQPQDCINGNQCCSLENGDHICGAPGGQQSCCSPLETCMPDGTCCATGVVSGGTCCPANTTACGGGACCTAGQNCVNGACVGCPAGGGQVACGAGTNLCCDFASQCCGNTCCGGGTECCALQGDPGPTCHVQGTCNH